MKQRGIDILVLNTCSTCVNCVKVVYHSSCTQLHIITLGTSENIGFIIRGGRAEYLLVKCHVRSVATRLAWGSFMYTRTLRSCMHYECYGYWHIATLILHALV